MEITKYEHGVPSWVDVSSHDLDATIAFYSGLFGWECEKGPAEYGGYTQARLRGKTVAGLGPNMIPGAPNTWSTYINVDSADDIAVRVAANGGSVLAPPMDVDPFGRMAFFTDPTGAVFGVWQPESHPGSEIVNEANTFCWNELLTTDIAAAASFYSAVFGWTAHTSDGDTPYTEFQLNDRSVAGMMIKPAVMPAEVPNFWSVYFAVDDLDASIALATALGGATVSDIMTVGIGRFCPLVDSTGASFLLIQMNGA